MLTSYTAVRGPTRKFDFLEYFFEWPTIGKVSQNVKLLRGGPTRKFNMLGYFSKGNRLEKYPKTLNFWVEPDAGV